MSTQQTDALQCAADLDDEIVASETVNDLRKLVDAARKQGGRV